MLFGNSGIGLDMGVIARAYGIDATGVDSSPDLIEKATPKVIKNNPKTKRLLPSFAKLSYLSFVWATYPIPYLINIKNEDNRKIN
mgnify:CR=1 FL=1